MSEEAGMGEGDECGEVLKYSYDSEWIADQEWSCVYPAEHRGHHGSAEIAGPWQSPVTWTR